jgi:hypothetical protein
MKHIKSFKLFESYSSFEYENSRLSDLTKELVSNLNSNYVKLETKDARSEEEYRKLRAEALEKVKNGDEKAYGAMKWDGKATTGFFIAGPAKAIQALQKPINRTGFTINYLEDPGKWCVIDVLKRSNASDSSSLYMEVDGEVLYQWSDYEKKAKGKLA